MQKALRMHLQRPKFDHMDIAVCGIHGAMSVGANWLSWQSFSRYFSCCCSAFSIFRSCSSATAMLPMPRALQPGTRRCIAAQAWFPPPRRASRAMPRNSSLRRRRGGDRNRGLWSGKYDWQHDQRVGEDRVSDRHSLFQRVTNHRGKLGAADNHALSAVIQRVVRRCCLPTLPSTV
jgi:hypothetical protein